MKKPTTRLSFAALVSAAFASTLLFSISPAFGHHAESMSNAPFLQGLSMPVHGLDHLLSAFAVGLVAAQIQSSRRVWLVGLYALIALFSGLLNVSGVTLPDCAVPLTVAAAGLLLWKGAAKGSLLACLTVAAAGFCHGDALLSRSVAGPHWTLFSAGCLLATLLVCGVAFFAGRLVTGARLRWAGAALLASTTVLLLFPEANGVLIRLLEGAQ